MIVWVASNGSGSEVVWVLVGSSFLEQAKVSEIRVIKREDK
tara:strand:+ start:313 stop:435 length:123 start_codon:yes stop_codon:yes gene_type:complete